MSTQTDKSDPNVRTAGDTKNGDGGLGAPAFSPLYRQIKGLILNSLNVGEWRPGEVIPSEIELAARFGVSQGTVRKAIDDLAAENLLLRRQGRGTFVATHAEQTARFRFLKLVPDHGEPGSEGPATRHIVDCKSARASAEVARALQLRSGESVLQVRRVLSFSAAPAILEDIWLPASPFKGLSAARLASYQGSMYALFEAEFHVRMIRADEKIRAVNASELHATMLKVAPGTALLCVERVAFTYRDKPMEMRRGFYRTDTHYYHNELG